MSESKLYLRRLCPHTFNPFRLTVGKLYKVTKVYTDTHMEVRDDLGGAFSADKPAYWQKVWVLPDGSEVPAL